MKYIKKFEKNINDIVGTYDKVPENLMKLIKHFVDFFNRHGVEARYGGSVKSTDFLTLKIIQKYKRKRILCSISFNEKENYIDIFFDRNKEFLPFIKKIIK